MKFSPSILGGFPPIVGSTPIFRSLVLPSVADCFRNLGFRLEKSSTQVGAGGWRVWDMLVCSKESFLSMSLWIICGSEFVPTPYDFNILNHIYIYIN